MDWPFRDLKTYCHKKTKCVYLPIIFFPVQSLRGVCVRVSVSVCACVCVYSTTREPKGSTSPCPSPILSFYKTPKNRRVREGSTGSPSESNVKYQCQYDTGLRNRKSKLSIYSFTKDGPVSHLDLGLLPRALGSFLASCGLVARGQAKPTSN